MAAAPLRPSDPSPALVRRWRRPRNASIHVAGIGLLVASAGMLVSALVELVDGGGDVGGLLLAGLVTAVAGWAGWRGTEVPERLSPASAFAATTWTWILVSLAGALPFVIVGTFGHVDDAVFESVSGFTAAGSSVLSPIEGNGAGILFWRSFTQWYGGMGMVLLAVSVLPFLGVGGLELIKAEGPGPSSDRLAPRVRDTARRLWYVYVGITAAATAGLLAVGLSPYDAVVHAFTAVSTGGYSPYDASVAHFDSIAVEVVLMVAMLAGATSFILHWRVAVHGDWGAYWRSPEFRFFASLMVGLTAFVALLNVADGVTLARSLRDSAFNIVSVGTTTGFGTADFAVWVPAAQLALLGLMISGAMTGSTSGAVKLLRFQVLLRYARRELHRARHPHGVSAVRVGDRPVDEGTIGRIVGFLVLYFAVFMVGVLVIASLGSDLVTAIGSVATSMGGVGPGLGEAGPVSNFLVFTRPARMVLALLMLLGRLEIFPMLLMFAAAGRAVNRRRARVRRAHRAPSPRPNPPEPPVRRAASESTGTATP